MNIYWTSNQMTADEAMDYIKAVGIEGVTLTNAGKAAAIGILSRRKDWTEAHARMLAKVEAGANTLPLNLARLTSGTRLGAAIDLAKQLAKNHIRNQKTKARRKAAKARRRAAA